jgi:hypothetical protein
MEENPIDKDKTTDLPGLLPYAHHVGSAIIRPDDMGKIKVRALTAMEEQGNIQLRQIREQIELLVKQANDIKDRARISYEIYQARMGFEPIVGHQYHLYKEENGQQFLSMIGPDEWGRSGNKNEFVCSVRLSGDHTWVILKP